MTDHQFLDVAEFPDKKEITNALAKKIAGLDFENDIETIFDYIKCSKRIILKEESNSAANDPILTEEYREIIKPFGIEPYDSPEKLVNHFTALYDDPSLRFNELLWKSAIESLKIYTENQLITYLKPVADFLNTKPYIKSNVILLIRETLHFQNFFPSVPTEENEEFRKHYALVYRLLSLQNTGFDIYAEILNTGEFTSAELDFIYSHLMLSSDAYSNENYIGAFNVLTEIAPDIKPLFIVQRELNILYKVIFIDKIQDAPEFYIRKLNDAIEKFPEDEELLYHQLRFYFDNNTPEKFREEAIGVLKKNPNHSECLFLLGKCYLTLGKPKAALSIFENLMEMHPLNMKYATNAALATRQYVDFLIKEYNEVSYDKSYVINIISILIEKKMFDDIAFFADKTSQEDQDLKALLLYAKDAENYFLTGKKDRKELQNALSFTKDKEIIRQIKEYYLDGLSTEQVKEEKDFIFTYYNENVNNAKANYQLAMFYYFENDPENAYRFFLQSREINPANIETYFYLARTSYFLAKNEKAITYSRIYLLHHKYNIYANQIYCDAVYAAEQFKEAHEAAKWQLTSGNTNENITFFYYTAGLSKHLSQFNQQYYNLQHVNYMLELYDEYPKPDNFWTDDNGSMSMYWAGYLCYQIGHFEKGIEYAQCILENVKEYNWMLQEKCLELLTLCLQGLQQYERLIRLTEPLIFKMLEKKQYDFSASQSAFYLSYAYFEMNDHENRMKWALTATYCFMQAENPDLNWAETYLINNFSDCMEFGVENYIIPFGKAYLDLLKEPAPNHIWVAYSIASTYYLKGEENESMRYFRLCLEFGTLFPGTYTEQIMHSENFLKTFNT